MMRVMVIPAAGIGSRLQSETPKVLFPVNGKAMIDHLFSLYAPYVDHFVLILNPEHSARVKHHCRNLNLPIEFELQRAPTGMLDAILIPQEGLRLYLQNEDDQVWITWCDQIAVRIETIERLDKIAGVTEGVVMPTVTRHNPYIHWVRDENGELVGLLQKREGDEMPGIGEGDVGLFSMSRRVYLDLLPNFHAESRVGNITREKNFLPFITWVADKAPVETFPAHHEIESVGVNTRAELELIENYFNGKTETLSNHSGI